MSDGAGNRLSRASPTAADLTALRDGAGSLARDPLAAPGVLAAAAGLGLEPPAGVVAGVAVVALWGLTSPLYAATLAALLGAIVAPAAPGRLAVAAGVGAMLLSLAVHAGSRWRALLATGVAALALGGLVAVGLRAGETGLTALGVLVAAGVAGYAVHRYSLVRTAYRDVR